MNRIRYIQEHYRLVLGSGSPRRKELLQAMGIRAEVRPIPIDEVYPIELESNGIAEYLSSKKADAHLQGLRADELLITSDTVVWNRGNSLEKPSDRKQATDMLQRLSGGWHEVISGICIATRAWKKVDSATTRVRFRELQQDEIEYYVDHFQPFDKAGAYGIQEWIGLIGAEEIQGSYSNVVGLPTQLLYRMLGEISVPSDN